ncbi:glycosyltransferase family 2 protein [Methylomonas methanica]|uniref:Glycosyl transferase family 2 n=1 Tax=Methylomonas methanica TaxID=421 RepID=A0A177MMU0_METMH|nr:glycosyltransferase family 2 protein [Methylomonas methanica]OAI07108.1 glycosyl transferase family 2 [Methylomonas methanica]
MPATISAIIVNYNSGNLLKTCLDSLSACASNVEIIVVDNASKDDSLDVLVGIPDVKLVNNLVNVGFAVACNIGIRLANNNNLLFLNPDCTIEPNALSQLIMTLAANDSVGMVGGHLINPDGTEQAGGRRAIPTPWRSFVRAFGLVRFSGRWPRLFFDFHLHNQPLPQQPIEVEAISGACMLVKREAIKDVGVWDEDYFLHCEDLDWCMRFRQKGWKIMFVPSAKIVHEQGACSRSRPLFVEWHKHKGMLRFYRKFFRHQYPGVLMGLVTLGVWFRFVLIAGYYTFKRFGKS